MRPRLSAFPVTGPRSANQSALLPRPRAGLQPITRRPALLRRPLGCQPSPAGCDVTARRGSGGAGSMAAPREPGGEAAFAQRIDPAREPGLSPEQRLLMAQVERAQRQRALQRRLRGRNVLLALGIGAVALGICILRGAGPGWGGSRRGGAAPAVFLNGSRRRLHLLLGVAGAVPGRAGAGGGGGAGAGPGAGGGSGELSPEGPDPGASYGAGAQGSGPGTGQPRRGSRGLRRARCGRGRGGAPPEEPLFRRRAARTRSWVPGRPSLPTINTLCGADVGTRW